MVRRHGEVLLGEKMLQAGTDPESYITEHTLVYEDKVSFLLLEQVWTAYSLVSALQGYLAYKKRPPPSRSGLSSLCGSAERGST